MTRTNAKELALHAAAGHQLVPLHDWNDRDEEGRERGKSPIHRNWTRKPYRNEEQVSHMERGRNVGVRLTAKQLVVDVDPRNFEPIWEGVDPFSEFVLRLGLDPDDWARVDTGSGGMHYYLTKPEDVSVRDSLPDFPGVEFKSLGRQVVAAGSVHPNGQRYKWDRLSIDPANTSAAPVSLLEAIARPATSKVNAGGGEHSAEEIKKMLDALDPEDFRDHDNWLQLMQACHHASAGEARQEFIEWSIGDPIYSDHSGLIGRRWDSLNAEPSGAAVTFRTLHKLLRDAGCEDAIPRRTAEEDFDGLEEIEASTGGSGDPLLKLVGEMNRTYCALIDGGVFQIFREEHDPVFKNRRVWSRMSREAFRHFFEDETVTPFGSKKISKADLWLQSPHRRKYSGIVMDPKGLRESEDKLNLWRGWSVESARGNWSMMRELIGDVLCDGSSEAENYVLRWIAHMLQKPWETPEAAIAFRGEEGTGKGTLGRALMRIAGPHGLTVSSSKQFAGRFNDHLRDCIFLFADEAVWPGDKDGEGVLKQLITEPVISYEGKYKGIVSGLNMVHLMLASNEEWVVPAGPEARRYFVSDVSDRRKRDQQFFGRLAKQMENGGLAAMVHDLMAMDLTGWRPAMNIPQTQALADQKLRSMKPARRFWFELLSEGELPVLFDAENNELDWRATNVVLGLVEKDAIVSAFDRFLKRNQLRSERASHKALVEAGRAAVGLTTSTRGGGSERTWVLPSLTESRARFEQQAGMSGLFG